MITLRLAPSKLAPFRLASVSFAFWKLMGNIYSVAKMVKRRESVSEQPEDEEIMVLSDVMEKKQ